MNQRLLFITAILVLMVIELTGMSAWIYIPLMVLYGIAWLADYRSD